jgi:molybdopterin synthase sulfur carrier subunit
MALVWIPSLLRDLTGGKATVRVSGRTVAQVIEALEAAYPGIKARLAPEGKLAPGLAVAIDNVVAPLGLRTPVEEESEVRFLPAVGGG